MITVDRVMRWEPCPQYTRERVVELFAGRETLTPREIAALDIPPDDIVWTLLAWLGAYGHDKIMHSLACDFAERALKRERDAGREPHMASWAAVEVKRAWMRGEATDEDLVAAGAAAWDAAWAAARGAAGAAARDAAGAAARDAAGAAARDAAWAAARDAAWAAARDAAWAAAWDAVRDVAHLTSNAARAAAWVVEARQQITMILEVMP